MSKRRKLSTPDKVFFFGLLMIGVLAGLFFPPLWIIYFVGGVFWFAYLGTRHGRHDDE
jgi:hypothetical protein